MRLKRARMPASLLVALVLAVSSAALYLFTGSANILKELEARSFEWRLQVRGSREPPADLVIIAVDDKTLSGLGRWPLPRAVVAEAVTAIEAAEAKSIGIDILFLEPEAPYNGVSHSSGDQKLMGALRQMRRTILAMALLFEDAATPGQDERVVAEGIGYSLVLKPASGALQPPRAHDALMPIPPLRQAARVGHVNVVFGGSGDALSIYPAVLLDGAYIPAFSVELAAEQLSIPWDRLGIALDGMLLLGDRRVPLDVDLSLTINPYGSEGTITTYSLIDLLEERLPEGSLKGKSVLLGATAVGVGERFNTPLDDNLPGVELLAGSTANLLDDSAIVRTPETRLADAGVMLAMGALAWFIGRGLGLRLAGLGLAVQVVACWGLAYLVVVELQLWMAVAPVTILILACGGIGMVSRAAVERLHRREAERQRRNLARYVSPLMAERLAAAERPDFDRRNQDAAILFIDLGGFTGESESRPPAETVDFLVAYHGLLERVVLAHGGVIEQFQGDGAMVIFGLPEPQPDDPPRALACARALVQALFEWQPALSVRAGLHFGPVTIAQLGGQSHAQLAAAGDTVNVASRLEQLAKERHATLVISDDLAARVRDYGQEDLLQGFENVDPQPLRGRQRPLGLMTATRQALGVSQSES